MSFDRSHPFYYFAMIPENKERRKKESLLVSEKGDHLV
jgi:hypothetical protein